MKWCSEKKTLRERRELVGILVGQESCEQISALIASCEQISALIASFEQITSSK